jgi:hypothetical protein
VTIVWSRSTLKLPVNALRKKSGFLAQDRFVSIVLTHCVFVNLLELDVGKYVIVEQSSQDQ